MIQSFADRDTEELFREEKNRRFAPIARIALRKLIQMNQAGRISDIAVPPGNRLGQTEGQTEGGPMVELQKIKVTKIMDWPTSVSMAKTLRHA